MDMNLYSKNIFNLQFTDDCPRLCERGDYSDDPTVFTRSPAAHQEFLQKRILDGKSAILDAARSDVFWASYATAVFAKDALATLNRELRYPIASLDVGMYGGRTLSLPTPFLVEGMIDIEASFPAYRDDGSLIQLTFPVLARDFILEADLAAFAVDPARPLIVSARFVRAWERLNLRGLFFSPHRTSQS